MPLLNGWKEIAGYAGRGVRTVQRWEILYGFPIHRPKGVSPCAVLAMTEEVDAWGQASRLRQADEIADLKAEIEALKAELKSIKTERFEDRSNSLPTERMESPRPMQRDELARLD